MMQDLATTSVLICATTHPEGKDESTAHSICAPKPLAHPPISTTSHPYRTPTDRRLWLNIHCDISYVHTPTSLRILNQCLHLAVSFDSMSSPHSDTTSCALFLQFPTPPTGSKWARSFISANAVCLSCSTFPPKWYPSSTLCAADDGRSCGWRLYAVDRQIAMC